MQVVYVTAVVPYIVLIILLIWNAQLEGAWLGVKFYLVPDWSKLGTAKVRAYTSVISIAHCIKRLAYRLSNLVKTIAYISTCGHPHRRKFTSCMLFISSRTSFKQTHYINEIIW